MPEIIGLNSKPRLFEGWREVTPQMAQDAQVTRKLAHALLISLGQSNVVRVVAFRIANALSEVNTDVNPDNLAEKITRPDPSKEDSIKATLRRAIQDSTLVEQAFSIMEQQKAVHVLTDSDVEAIKALPDTRGIQEIIERGAREIDFVEEKFELVATVDSLLKVLGKDFTKRRYTKRVIVEEKAKPKKVKKKITEPAEAVSTLPGVSYLIEGMRKAKPLNRLNRMGATSEAKLTRALKKCLKTESGYVDVTKGTVMFMNLITRNFVETFEGKPVNAVIMFEGTKFKVSKLPNDQNGFRIKKVK